VTVEPDDEPVDDLRVRLRRIDGQVRAVGSMLADGSECRDIVDRLGAATDALGQVGFRLLVGGLTYCVEHPDEAVESGYPLDEGRRLFTTLA